MQYYLVHVSVISKDDGEGPEGEGVVELQGSTGNFGGESISSGFGDGVLCCKKVILLLLFSKFNFFEIIDGLV